MAQVIESHLNVDPIIRPPSPPSYIIDKSGSAITITQYSADSDSNSGSIIFSNITPSEKTYVNRKFLLAFEAEFVLTGSGGYTGPIFPGGNLAGVVAPRCLPVQSNATAINLTINGVGLSLNGNQILEPVSRFGWGKDYVDTDMSLVPAYHDVAEYDQSYNTNLNPLAPVFDNSAVQPRGAFLPTIVSDANGVAVLRYKWQEFMLISPLIWKKFNEYGFYGVDNLLITMNLNSDYGRMLSYDNVNGTPLSSITGQFIAKPIVYIQTITPIVPPPDVPRLYPYVNMIATPSTSTTSIPPGGTLDVTTSNQQLSGIPSKLLLYARRQDADRSAFTADTYAYISKISINFDNTPNIFSTYGEQQLYQFLMAEQGFKYPYNLVKNYLGSCLMIDFGNAIPSTLLQAVGLSGKFNFQATLTLKNLYSSSAVFSIYVIPMYDAIMSIENNTAQTAQSIVRNVDVLNAELAQSNRFSYPNPHPDAIAIDGGDFLQMGKRFVKQAVKQGAAVGKQAIDLAQKGKAFYDQHKDTIDDIISGLVTAGKTAAVIVPLLFGAGYDQRTIYAHMRPFFSDVELAGAGLVGGALVGGCNGMPCIGGQMVTNPDSLLTGGSIVPYKKVINKVPVNKGAPRKRLGLEARS